MNSSTTSDLLSTAQQAADDIIESAAGELPALAEMAGSVVVPPALGLARRLVGWRVAVIAAIAGVGAAVLWRYWREQGDDTAADDEKDALSHIPTVDNREPVQ